jgi:hypothetical protein
MSAWVRGRTVASYVVLAGALLVGGTASGADLPGPDRGLDTASSAHPSPARPAATDTAFAQRATWQPEVDADASGIGSATCDGCAAESTTLQVLYVPRARVASLDNAAVAWAQTCGDCTATALSVQVVVLRGRPTVVPNNRGLALTAACTTCRSAAAAFQLVVVADRADRLDDASLADLRAWVDAQAAALRASVATPTAGPAVVAPSERAGTRFRGGKRKGRAADPAAAAALAELTGLVTTDLAAETVASDVVLTR